jgi:acetyl esterase/lipase
MQKFFDTLDAALNAANDAARQVALQTEKYEKKLCKGLYTEKRDGWNKRFYLLMVDVRTLANSAPSDLGSLRSLTDAAGVPAGAVTPSGIKTQSVDASGVRCVWCWPSSFDTAFEVPIKMLYIHGGAFCLGSPETHKQLACELAKRSQVAVLLPDYRRCPEHTISDAHQDILTVYEWMLAGGGEGAAPVTGDIVFGGESAGANIALGLALKLRSRESKLPLPSGLLLMSPWADLVDAVEQSNPSWTENEGNDFVLSKLAFKFARWVLVAQKLGGVSEPWSADSKQKFKAFDAASLVEIASSQEVSPALAKDFRGLPKILITTGACETLRDSQLRLVRRLADDGVPVDHELYPDMPHAFALVNFAASSTCTAPSDVIDRAAAFVISCSKLQSNSRYVATGVYVVTSDGLPVYEAKARESTKLAQVPVGTLVNVLEIAEEPVDGRIRARIADPAGWITLCSADGSQHHAKLSTQS